MSNQYDSVTVSTTEDLKRAQKQGVKNITILGDLAEKIHKSRKIAKLGKFKLAILTSAIAAATVSAPMTGGMSYSALVPVAAITGMELVLISFIFFAGLSLIIALANGYEVIEFSPKKLVLRKKAS